MRERTPMRYARPAVAALLAAAAATAGCGQSDDRATVRATTERFLAAHAADQGETACAALAEDTRAELEKQESRACADAIGDVELEGGAVAGVEVAMTGAKVDLAGGESVFLSEQAAGWRISAVGCTPQGDPRAEPFDCELEA